MSETHKEWEGLVPPRKWVRIHDVYPDGTHAFCCGPGEEFVQKASGGIVSDEALSALLPLVSRYACQYAAIQLREAAADITWVGTSTVRDALTSRADELDGPCQCPDEHCGDCGCCP